VPLTPAYPEFLETKFTSDSTAQLVGQLSSFAISVIILEVVMSIDKTVALKLPMDVDTVTVERPVPGGPMRAGTGIAVGLGVTMGLGVGTDVGIGVGVVVGVGDKTIVGAGDGETCESFEI